MDSWGGKIHLWKLVGSVAKYLSGVIQYLMASQRMTAVIFCAGCDPPRH